MRLGKLVCIGGLFGIWLTLLVGCGAPTVTVKVMVAIPSAPETGREMIEGARFALEESGGMAGNIRVEILQFDTFVPGQPETSRTLEIEAVTRAAADPEIVAYLGAISSEKAKVAIPIADRASLAVISPSATWPGLTKPGWELGEPGIYYPTGQRNFFRLVPSDDIQGIATLHWWRDLGISQVYLINTGQAYSRGLTGIIEANAEDQRLTILGNDVLDPAVASDAQIKALAQKIASADPQAIYFPVGPEMGAIRVFAALRRELPRAAIFGADSLTSESGLSSAPTQYEGLYATSVIPDPQRLPSADSFLKVFQSRYARIPSPMVLTTHESMHIIIKAIATAGSPTRQNVLKALANLGENDGVLGRWSFDTHGDTSLRTITRWQFQRGKWVILS